MKIIKHGFVRSFSCLLALLGISYCVSSFVGNYQSIPLIDWNLSVITRLILLALIFFVAVLFYFEGWRVLVSSKEFPVSFGNAFVLMGFSQIAKYVPGNIFHYAGRMVLAVKGGMQSGVLTVSIVLETVLSLATVIVIVIVGMIADSSFRAVIASLLPGSFPWGALCIAGTILFAIVCLFMARRIKDWIYNVKNYLNPWVVCRAIIMYLLIFLLTGLIIKLIPWALWGNVTRITFIQAVWRFSLCWIAGFIVPGAPAGLGVREALFTRLFMYELGEGEAVCVALIFRMITTAGDILTFTIAWWLGRRLVFKSESNMLKT